MLTRETVHKLLISLQNQIDIASRLRTASQTEEKKRLLEIRPHAEKLQSDFNAFQSELFSSNAFSAQLFSEIQKRVDALFNHDIPLSETDLCVFEITAEQLLISNIAEPFTMSPQEQNEWSITERPSRSAPPPTLSTDIAILDDISCLLIKHENKKPTQKKPAKPAAQPIADKAMRNLKTHFENIKKSLQTFIQNMEKENDNIAEDNKIMSAELQTQKEHMKLRNAIELNILTLEKNQAEIQAMQNDLVLIEEFNTNMIEIMYDYTISKTKHYINFQRLLLSLEEMSRIASTLDPKVCMSTQENTCRDLHLLFALVKTEILTHTFRLQTQAIAKWLVESESTLTAEQKNDPTDHAYASILKIKNDFEKILRNREEKNAVQTHGKILSAAKHTLLGKLNNILDYLSQNNNIALQPFLRYALVNQEQNAPQLKNLGKRLLWVNQIHHEIEHLTEAARNEKLQLMRFAESAISLAKSNSIFLEQDSPLSTLNESKTMQGQTLKSLR